MKSQAREFKEAQRQARSHPYGPKPVKITQERNTATGNRVRKNKSRNERRKAARKTALLIKGRGVGAAANDGKVDEMGGVKAVGENGEADEDKNEARTKDEDLDEKMD